MSYVSGFMMGAAIGKGLRQFFTGAPRTAQQLGAQACQRGTQAYQRGVQVAAQVKRQAVQVSQQLSYDFACVSRLPGRRRYRAPLTPELAAMLQAQLPKLAFLQEFRPNAATGTLLFVYDAAAEAQMDALALYLARHIFRRPWRKRVDEAALPVEAHAGALTRSVRGSMRDFSAWIRRTTGGWLDVSSAAFLIFLLRGLRKMVLTKQYPSASQMLWWAVSLMRGWRTV